MYDNPWVDAAYAPPPQKPQRLGQPPKLADRLKYAAEMSKEKSKTAAKKVNKGATKGWSWIKLKCNKKKEPNPFYLE